MTGAVVNVVKRDRRLSLALLLFVISAGALLIQTWIATLYFGAAVNQNWEVFLDVFPSVAPPPTEPGVHCFDKCQPDLPFVAGWIGIVSFVLGLIVLAYSWWTPKPHASSSRSEMHAG